MRMSLPKALAFSIAALFLGGALAATPALAAGLYRGSAPGGFYRPSGGLGGFHPSGGGPLSGGSLSHPNFVPSGTYSHHLNGVPYTDPAWSKSGNQHQRFWRYWRHRYGWGRVVIPSEVCDDAYCNNGADYDDSDCWVLRRVYNRYGKFVGWRRVYICQDEQ